MLGCHNCVCAHSVLPLLQDVEQLRVCFLELDWPVRTGTCCFCRSSADDGYASSSFVRAVVMVIILLILITTTTYPQAGAGVGIGSGVALVTMQMAQAEQEQQAASAVATSPLEPKMKLGFAASGVASKGSSN